MAHCAEKQTGYECVFAISKGNVDKADLTDEEMLWRKNQFTAIGRECLVFSQYTFIGISTSVRQTLHLHPCERLYFVVGMDTILRINNPKYVYDSPVETKIMFSRLKSMNVRFIVCERDGVTFDQLQNKIDGDLLALCENCYGYQDGGESSTAIRGEIPARQTDKSKPDNTKHTLGVRLKGLLRSP